MGFNGKILKIARERVHLSQEELARKMGVSLHRIQLWESGTSPTFHQLKKLSRILLIPQGYFYLSRFPELILPIPDFRTLSDKKDLSPEALQIVYDIQDKVAWLEEWRELNGVLPFEYVGSFSSQSEPHAIVEDILSWIPVDEIRKKTRRRYEFLMKVVQHAESIGICVAFNGIHFNNTRRKISLEDFRGFCFASKRAPFIFINSRNTLSGQLFTLFHELCHVWIGRSGISTPMFRNLLRREYDPIESLCDRVSAHVLMPEEEFIREWKRYSHVQEQIEHCSRYFHTSPQSLLIRAKNLGLISKKLFNDYYEEYSQAKEYKRSGFGRGDFISVLSKRNSSLFTYEVIHAMKSQNITWLEACRFLHAKSKHIASILEKLKHDVVVEI